MIKYLFKDILNITIFIFIAGFVIFVNICFADTLYLKNGNEIEGKVVEETDIKVVLEIFGGTIEIHKAEIQRIEHKELSEEAQERKKEGKKERSKDLERRDALVEKPVNTAELLEAKEFIIYIPSGIKLQRRYPMVVALSPAANAQSMINAWKDTSEKNKWIIFASKEYRNGLDMNQIIPHLATILENVLPKLPVNRSKIIATGFSGGGMGAHAFAFSYPELISALIINTGKIHEHYIGQKYRYPERKIAVFLASPTDFRYEEMKRDRDFLKSLGWKTKWIEFKGGHRIAPVSVYRKATHWLKRRF